MKQVSAVSIIAHRLREAANLISIDVTHTIGHFLDTDNLEPRAFFNRFH